MPTHQRPLIIALEGIIASGKTTLLKQLQTHSKLKIKVIPEPIDAWKNVQKFNVREYLRPQTHLSSTTTDPETTSQLIHNSHNSHNGYINTTNNHTNNANLSKSNNNHRIFDDNKNDLDSITTTTNQTTVINPANTNSLISTYEASCLPLSPPTEETIKEQLEDQSQFELLSQMYNNPQRWSYSFQV